MGGTNDMHNGQARNSELPAGVLNALAEAERVPGWNNRRRDIRCFELAGSFGHCCTLYVVPFRRWAYRRIEKQAAALHREQGVTA
jgi:hypothetical protein